jgi:hypothetical protein
VQLPLPLQLPLTRLASKPRQPERSEGRLFAFDLGVALGERSEL